MTNLTIARRYLKETTAHGFRYLVDGSNLTEKLVWICIIATAFTLSSIMVASNIKDSRENPIAVSIDTIPVQTLPFPAVTINAPVLDHPYRMIESVYNNIIMDCSDSSQHIGEETCQGCFDMNEKFREDLLPLLRLVFLRSYDYHYTDCFLFQRGANINEFGDQYLRSLLMKGICQPYTDPDGRMLRALQPCTSDPVGSDYLPTFLAHIANHSNIMHEVFETPPCDVPDAPVSGCETMEGFGGFEACSDVMMRLADDQICHALGTLNAIIILSEQFRPGVVLKTARGLNNTMISSAPKLLKSLLGGTDLDLSEDCLVSLVTGTNLSDCERDFNMDKLLSNLDVIYKLYRQTVPPTSKAPREKSEILDAKTIKQAVQSEFQVNMTSEDAINDYATILACKFGESELSQACLGFSPIFSSSGIGYTFNSEGFWNMFKDTPSNLAFFNEFVLADNINADQEPQLITNTGQGYSLDLVLRHDAYGYKEGQVNFYQEIFLSLHDPSDVPNLNSEGIIIQPGLFYEIRVYPAVTVSDESSLAMDPSKRNCKSKEEAEGLDIFKIYTQSVCIFECKLKQAISKCNCSTWNYPRIDESDKICLGQEASQCFQKAIEANIKSCNCLSDCHHVEYNVDLHVSSLKTGTNEQLLRWHEEYKSYKELNTYKDPIFDPIPPNPNDLSRVRISVQSRFATKITRSARTSFSSQVASLGGIIGLFTGMSMLSLAESIYWVVKYIEYTLTSNKDRGPPDQINDRGSSSNQNCISSMITFHQIFKL